MTTRPTLALLPGIALGFGAALGWLMIALVVLEIRHAHPALDRVRAAGGGWPL